MKKQGDSQEKKQAESTNKSIRHYHVRYLMLFNDDHNSFEYVIETLIKECNHNPEQAEQCAFITHYNGKCDIKKGTLKQLKPIYDKLIIKDLIVSIK